MIYTDEIILFPEEINNENIIKSKVAKKLNINFSKINNIEFVRKSIDARKNQVKFLVKINVYTDSDILDRKNEYKIEYKKANEKKPVIIVGSGPAGLFAALGLLEKGIKPIIIERGNEVRQRKRDIANILRNNTLNPESNYCFGEGGAGTFSDGKLYTRSSKRGDVGKMLITLFNHGANESILFESHPHIGTDKLPGIIENIRKTIINFGGEFYFNHKLEDLLVENSQIKGVIASGKEFISDKVILATGHSAKDVYKLLDNNNIIIEAKPFAMGVRIEHPQHLINEIQYPKNSKYEILPAATYSLVNNFENRGTYSFCMCPGGYIVPSSTNERELVVNGMSPSKRNSPFANSGIVVEIKESDLDMDNKFSGLEFQENIEKLAYINGGSGLIAPAQRLTDFLKNKISHSLPECSYIPGIISSPMHFWLPEVVIKNLQIAFKNFDNKMKGFLTNEAIIVGVESRTSSSIRIPRNNETYEHVQIKGLFPCGEGAGYAGGIISCAIDGDNLAKVIS